MGKKLLSALCWLILLPSVFALTCDIYDSCPSTMADLVYLSNQTNSHSQLVNYTPHYTHVLCCNSSSYTIGNSSDGTVFLRLANQTNSHAQITGSYKYPVYISADTNITCTTSTSCSANYTCLLSISSTSNAHIANCSHYSTQICCTTENVTVTSTPPPGGGAQGGTPLKCSLDFDKLNYTLGEQVNLTVICPPTLVGSEYTLLWKDDQNTTYNSTSGILDHTNIFSFMPPIAMDGQVELIVPGKSLLNNFLVYVIPTPLMAGYSYMAVIVLGLFAGILLVNRSLRKKKETKVSKAVQYIIEKGAVIITAMVLAYLLMKPTSLSGYFYVVIVSLIMFGIILLIDSAIKGKFKFNIGALIVNMVVIYLIMKPTTWIGYLYVVVASSILFGIIIFINKQIKKEKKYQQAAKWK